MKTTPPSSGPVLGLDFGERRARTEAAEATRTPSIISRAGQRIDRKHISAQ